MPTLARSSVNFMQPMMGVISPMESMTIITNLSGERLPLFISSPPIGSTVSSVAGMMFMRM